MSNSTFTTNNHYQSPYGWQIDLPLGWHVAKQDREITTLSSPYAPLTVFCQDSDPSNSFSWMVNRQPIDKDLAAQFMSLTMIPGPVAEEEITSLLPKMFPAIGQLCATSIIEAEDGNRGLEVIEAFRKNGEEKRAYQRIFLLKDGGRFFFQRLAFYAALPVFEESINSVEASAQSFAYKRSFGLKPIST
jgi:hypothetical protein